MDAKVPPEVASMMTTMSMEGSSEMKRLSFLALAVLGAFAACDRAADTDSLDTSNAKTVTVKAGKAGAPDTKTAIMENDGVFSFTWKAGDKLAIVEAIPYIDWLIESDPDGNYPYITELYASEPLDEDMSEAVFSLNLEERDYVRDELQYVAIYPWDVAVDVAGDCWDSDNDKLYIPLAFPDYQEPTADSFDPAADVLVSKVVRCNDIRPSELSFEFARVGTIVKMVLNGLPEGAVISSGNVMLGFEATYYFHYDPSLERVVESDGTDGISFSFADSPLVVGPDRSVTVWLRSKSGVSDRLELWLYGEVDGKEVEWHRTAKLYAQGKTLEFKEGGLTTFSFRMGKPDVDNPDPDLIDYSTNATLDGVTVTWPHSTNPNLEGYECYLLDENNVRYNFTSSGPVDGGLYAATITGGLAPGLYDFYVRALAVEGKESQKEYEEKDELAIGVPITLTINYVIPNEHGSEDSNWSMYLSGHEDVDTEDRYRDITFFYRNLERRYGSPSYIFGEARTKSWALWNKTPVRWSKIAVTLQSGNSSLYSVYSSDGIFSGGAPSSSDTPLAGSGGVYMAGNKKYFLITGGTTARINQITLEYYK